MPLQPTSAQYCGLPKSAPSRDRCGGDDGPVRRVEVDGAQIEYRIRRSRRRKKTYQVSIVEGQALLVAPHRTTNAEAEDLIRHKARWILSKLEAAVLVPTSLAFLSGEKLPYLGRDLTLWVQGEVTNPSGQPQVSREGGWLKVTVLPGQDETTRGQQVAEAVVAWYVQQAREHIDRHLARWLPTLTDGAVPTVKIRNQKRRWGSCSSTGALHFNWRLAMLEPSLTEYVVVHELCHLTHMNHSPAFWDLVARHLPDVKERRRRLRELEATLPAL